MLNVARVFSQEASPLALVNKAWEAGRKCRAPVERVWYLTRAFLAGDQYVQWSLSQERMVRIPGKYRKGLHVENIMLPRYNTQVARLAKRPPRWEVLPNGTDDVDIKAAQLGRQILHHLDRALKMGEKREDLARWVFSTGNGYLFDTWAVSAGRPIEEPLYDQAGNLNPAVIGDVSVEVDSPFCWYWPAVPYGPTRVEDMPWGLRVTLRPLAWFHTHFDLGHKVKAEKLPPSPDLYTYATPREQVPSAEAAFNTPVALCKELFLKPTPQYPRGAYIVAAGDVVLMLTDFPTYEGRLEYPVTHFTDIRLPGTFWGWPTAWFAIPIQREWNSARSSIANYVRGMAKVKWFLPKGSGVSKAAINDEHAEVIEYQPQLGIEPRQSRVSPLPAAVFNHLVQLQEALRDLFSQHEISEGRVPPNIRSSWALNVLRETDEEPITPVHRSFERGLARVGRHMLIHVAERYTDERVVKIVGAGNQVQVVKFRGADLRGNTDVHVVTDSSLPDSRVAKQAAILERYEAGLYGPVADPATGRRVRRLLDEVVEEDIYADETFDRQNAENENTIFGEIAQAVILDPENLDEHLARLPRPMPFDNDGIHLRAHELDMKRPERQEYFKTPVGQVDLQLRVLHSQQHLVRIMASVGGAGVESAAGQQSAKGRNADSMPVNPPNRPPGRMERQE